MNKNVYILILEIENNKQTGNWYLVVICYGKL